MINEQSILHILKRAFPDQLSDNVEKIFPYLLPLKSASDAEEYSLFLDGVNILIPHRVSFHAPNHSVLKEFTKDQIAIVSSIMTRDHSGFVRQEWLERLLDFPSSWTSPFVALLLGEYVIEILESIDQKIDNHWEPFLENLLRTIFYAENKLTTVLLVIGTVITEHSIFRFVIKMDFCFIKQNITNFVIT